MTVIPPLYSAIRKKNPLLFFPRRELVKGAHGCTSAVLEHMHYTLVYADPPKTSGPLVPFLWLFCLRSIPLLIPDLPHCCPIKFLMVHSLPSNFLGYASMTPFCYAVTHPLLTDALMSSVLLYFWYITQLMTHSLTNQFCLGVVKFSSEPWFEPEPTEPNL